MEKLRASAFISTLFLVMLFGRSIPGIHSNDSGVDWTSEQAKTADAFQQSIGVNTHVSYTDTAYFKLFPNMLSKLEAAKILHVRDGYFYRTAADPGSSSTIFRNHKTFAASNIGVLYSVGTNNNGGITRPLMESYLRATGDAEGLEGGNECDLNKCIGQAIALYPNLKQVARNMHLYVVAPSMTSLEGARVTGDLSSYIDYTNIHVYYGGRMPFYGWGDSFGNSHGDSYASTRWWLNIVQAVNGKDKLSMVTETGYPSVSSVVSNPPNYTLIDAVAASYIPRTLLNNFNAGVVRTFLYEFVDEGNAGAEQTYGLLRSDLTEKPAYVALKNLSLMTFDSGPKFIPQKLAYKVQGATRDTFHTLLQKSDGTFLLILWQEVSSWDPKTMTAKRVVPNPITLTLAGSHRLLSLSTFDSTGQASVTTLSGSVLTDLPITDQLSVLVIR